MNTTTRGRYRKTGRPLHPLAIAAAFVTGVVLLIGACSTDPTDADKASSTAPPASEAADESTTPPAVPAVDEPAPEPEPEPEEVDSGIAQVGPDEWFTYEDGIELQVTGVESFTLGEYAFSGNPGDTGVIVTVTIKNGTDGVFDTSLADVMVTYGPNGDATEREYDHPGFEGSIPPGKTATAKYDFGVVPDKYLGELLVQVEPSWDHMASFFEGGAS